MNADARTGIGDDELAWIENAITVGDGGDIHVVNGPGTAIATLTQGVASLWGYLLSGSPVLIAVGGDGSLSQIAVPSGTVTSIAPAGTVTTGARCTIWRDLPVLIIDPQNGYFSWDGTSFVVIDSTRRGTTLAVFQGRAWIASGRTITYSAPLDYDDFTAASGGGSTIITDEAFLGDVVALVSALEQLWIVGEGAIEAISNVVTTGTPLVTTFSVTNIVANLGSSAPASVIGYFRALAFMAPFGAYALSGVTPQKISEKLDGMFPDLTLTPDVPAAVAIIHSLPFLLFLATYSGPNARAGAGPHQMVLGFTQGKWALFAQGNLRWITTLLVSGVSQAWGTDGFTVYRLFGAPDTTAVGYKVQSKLYDFGAATTMKAALKVGFEYRAANAVAPSMTVDTERIARAVTVTGGGAIVWTNSGGGVIQFQNALGQNLNFTTQAFVLSRQSADAFGRYLGWTVTGEDPPYSLQGFAMEYVETRRWSNPLP